MMKITKQHSSTMICSLLITHVVPYGHKNVTFAPFFTVKCSDTPYSVREIEHYGPIRQHFVPLRHISPGMSVSEPREA
ncbi:hypothetical protein ETA_02280 [Erwinia tasmaniensis Et1/99]|uniref:Uncharacterized protein n=1 Tax=Erwinia tasmaniensis (strain DSM 17950 / CFBP 7177 / CIP 109463 / NCPPB 4357 / Et1/99) TaxID=465817 RepID=B2VI62_ERWT9|nr:hypothetical protein ETA_02280 [Erwinia tasmaniensis Et1/99]